MSGDDIRLAAFTGKPLLVVNTASLCGYTPQYAGLQEIWSQFRERGLTVIGVPSNDFADRSPAAPARSRRPRTTNYGVTFPIAAKAVVVGAKAHPFYKWAAEARPRDVPRWNFHKYLIGRGRLYRRGVSFRGRTGGHAGQDRDRQGARRQLTCSAQSGWAQLGEAPNSRCNGEGPPSRLGAHKGQDGFAAGEKPRQNNGINLEDNTMRVAAGTDFGECDFRGADGRGVVADPGREAPPLQSGTGPDSCGCSTGGRPRSSRRAVRLRQPAPPKQAPQPARARLQYAGSARCRPHCRDRHHRGPGFGFEHFKELDFLRDKEVVLTFDDGPWPRNTPAVLKALADECTTGIFFSIGKHATYEPEILKQVYAAGHTVGTHTWSHANLNNKNSRKRSARTRSRRACPR